MWPTATVASHGLSSCSMKPRNITTGGRGGRSTAGCSASIRTARATIPTWSSSSRSEPSSKLRSGALQLERVSLPPILSIRRLTKTYARGFQALRPVDLDIRRGEIFALLGPNGAGKSTLINIVCGLVRPSSGTVLADGHDIISDYRAARSLIGLAPQEIFAEGYETVWSTMKFSRGLHGKGRDPAYLESVLRDLSLWDKRDSPILALSGGMKRRVMIAKALSHEPRILFLDEPTAGVDVDLRRDTSAMARRLREGSVTIILTTHYIEETEETPDR